MAGTRMVACSPTPIPALQRRRGFVVVVARSARPIKRPISSEPLHRSIQPQPLAAHPSERRQTTRAQARLRHCALEQQPASSNSVDPPFHPASRTPGLQSPESRHRRPPCSIAAVILRSACSRPCAALEILPSSHSCCRWASDPRRWSSQVTWICLDLNLP
ncbi:hypothetical protein SORBI_3009G119501 [Sorghum bicolor]|uniref:Uncharacterized protein n=1 Tax=Sorghum bicolor TaxID=4558 RepID=A0A1Z5R295_SORBI|nr:hypothetical protein SORBI_3009G119501 [Sorghum bicolor]OQU77893.1 hypothetical protein SORBI_3009G119501 [Sorghum bicolor]